MVLRVLINNGTPANTNNTIVFRRQVKIRSIMFSYQRISLPGNTMVAGVYGGVSYNFVAKNMAIGNLSCPVFVTSGTRTYNFTYKLKGVVLDRLSIINFLTFQGSMAIQIEYNLVPYKMR